MEVTIPTSLVCNTMLDYHGLSVSKIRYFLFLSQLGETLGMIALAFTAY